MPALGLASRRSTIGEAQRNGIIGVEEAANLSGVPNLSQKGTRVGNWLTREQAKELLTVGAPFPLATITQVTAGQEARLTGTDFPDEWVVMGNHRDAWEFGGVDPSSGTASMLEMTRALGELKQQGIRPRRTLPPERRHRRRPV